MSQQIIDTGGEAGAGSGDDLFTAFTKINDNFTEIYSGNVVAANILVYSVAGRTGNVVLTAQDVFGAATYSNIAVLQANIIASLAAANAYTDAQIGNLGPLGNVTITGGTVSNVIIANSWGTLTNLTVATNGSINGQLTVGSNLSVANNLTVGAAVIFADNSQQTTAFQGFGNIFTNAAAQATAINLVNANVAAANAVLANVVGNLSIVGTTIYVQNSGEEITLQPDGTGNVYIGQSGVNDLVLGKGVFFDDGTYQDTAYVPGEYVTDAELSSNVTALSNRINAANAAIVVNTNRVAAANATIAALTSSVETQALNDAANVAAANAAIASVNNKISAANAAIIATNANVTAANAAIDAVESNVASLQSTVAGFDLTAVNANVTAANTQIAINAAAMSVANSAIDGLRANIIAANAVTAGVAAGQTAANALITALQSNAAIQATNIDILLANASNLDDSLTTQAGYITAINANVAAANAAIVALGANVTAANAHITQVDLDNANNAIAIGLANTAIALNTSRVNAANTAIGGLRANIIAANTNIASTNANVTAANSAINSLVLSDIDIRANVEAANAAIVINTTRVHAANTAIAALRANVTAANTAIDTINANVAAANAIIATLNAFDLTAVNANVAAANAVIAFHGARITLSNTYITDLRANVTAANADIAAVRVSLASTDANVAAANAVIATLGAGNLTLMNANITAANIEIDTLRANITASNVRINRLEANIGAGLYANAELPAIYANLAAANAVIASFSANIGELIGNDAVQSAAIFVLQANAQTQQAELDGKLPILNPNANGTLSMTGTIVATGNVDAQNINAVDGYFTRIYGEILTNAQPFITSVGTLTGLGVQGNVTALGITSTQGFTGQLKTAAQPLVTSLGTLTGLDVSGSANITGALGVNTITADVSIAVPTLNATTVNGTLGTAAQPNITSLGNLTALAVDGTTNLNDIIVAGNIRANAARSQLAVNSLSTNTVIAVQANITSLANIEAITGNTATFALDMLANNAVITYDVSAARVIASAGLNGTLETAAQPNITSLGTLTALAVSGNTDIGGNTNVTGNVHANWLLANVMGRTATFFGNVTTGNLSAAYITGVMTTSFQPFITTLGNLASLTVDGDTILTGNVSLNSQYSSLSATTGTFDVIGGYLTTATQPNVTALGTLTGLNVAGTVNVTGDQYITNDLWVVGNIYVNGNTTTVNAGNVTTSDKDLTLANNAVSSAAARGAGIYIGDGGIYGNISVYDDTWKTPQNFEFGGNIAAANAAFSYVAGTLTTGNQPNITAVGTLASLAVTGNVSAANLDITYGGRFANVITSNVTTTTITATQGDFVVLNIGTDITLGGLITLSNVVFSDGSFQVTAANAALAPTVAAINANVTAANIEIASLQANLLAANATISSNSSDILTLFANASSQQTEIDSINANVAAANATVSLFAGDISTLQSNASTQQTQIDLLNANVNAANAEIASTNANVAAANAIISVLNSVNLGGDPSIVGNLTVGSLKSNGNVETGGVYTTGNTTIWNNAGNATITTNSANLYINNYNAGTYATPFLGNVIVDANLHVGANVAVSANLYVDQVFGNIAAFSQVSGTLQTAAQPNITQVGTLIDLSVTGNVSTGNVSGTKGTFTELTGTVLTPAQPYITSVGNLTSLNVDTAITSANLNVGNLAVSGSFQLLAGSLNLQGDIVTTTNLVIGGNTSLANAAITGDLSAGGNLYIGGTADFGGNLQSTGAALILSSSRLDNNLSTGYILATGNVTALGNATANNFTTNTIVGANLSLTATDPSTSTTTGALTVSGGIGSGGNLWIAGNANVGGSLRTTNIIAEGPVYLKGQINLDNATVETNQVGIALFNSSNTDFITLGASAIDIKIGDENPVAPFYGIGNTYIRHSLTVAGNLHANNNTIVRSTTETTGSYSGALQVFGGAWIGANVYTSGNLDVTGTTRLAGATHIGGNTTVTGFVTVTGNTTVNGNTDITGTTTVTGDIRTTGSNLLMTANTSIVGETSVIGNLTVIAPYTSGNTFTVVGNVTMDRSLHVTETIYANSLIVAGGIGIPNIDNTPVGDVTPSRGTFTTLTGTIYQQARPRSNQRPRLMLDFANNPFLDPRITFARNSIGTYFDTTGNLVTAAAGVPRFTTDPLTNTSAGLLIEESRSNLFKYSDAFANTSYWQPLGATVAQTNHTDSPTGNFSDAYEIVEDSNNVLHGVYPESTNNQITATTTNYYVASAFVKAGTRTQFGIVFENEGGYGAIFDLSTKAVVAESAGSGGINSTSQIKELANGWFRISSVVYKQTTSGNIVFGPAENGSMIYTGNNGDRAGYIFGAQLEEGSFYTSYIPTTTAAVTRAADDVSINNIETFFDNNDGLLYVDSTINHIPTNKTGAVNGSAIVVATIRPTLLSIEGASVTNRIALLAENITTPSVNRFANLVIYRSGTLEANLGTTQTHFATLDSGRVAAYFKSNAALGITTNGNVATTITGGAMASGRLPDNLTTMYIGKGTASGYLNGTISKISYLARSSMSAVPAEEIRGWTQQ